MVRSCASRESTPWRTNSLHFRLQAIRRSMCSSSARGERRWKARPIGFLNLSRIRLMNSESLRFAFCALRRSLSDALARSRCSIGPSPSHSKSASVTTRMARQPKYMPSSFCVRGTALPDAGIADYGSHIYVNKAILKRGSAKTERGKVKVRQDSLNDDLTRLTAF